MATWSLLSYIFSSVTSSPLPVSQGERKPSIADYSLVDSKTLGSGADASVLAATHIASGNRVAMKVVEKAKRRPDQLDRSRFEGKLISTVFDHPNIIKGFPVVEDDRLLVLPMELAVCGDLLDYVNNRHGFPEPEARDVFRQLVEGLGHAHSKNVLHGDIKLENVVIFPPSKEQVRRGDFTRRFAICDWGYARYNTGEPLKKAFGSMLYSSPEVITGTGHFSTATDIWGLGVILYALIYATLPFGSKDLRQHIATANFHFPPHVPVSPDCKDLISSILRINPAQRHTIDQILAHPWLTGRRVPVEPPQPLPSSISNCSPLASTSSSSASNTSLASGTDSKESDWVLQPAPRHETAAAAASSAKPTPAAQVPPVVASKTPGCWYLGGDDDGDLFHTYSPPSPPPMVMGGAGRHPLPSP